MPYKDKKDLYAAQKRYRRRKLKLKRQIKEMPLHKRLELKEKFPPVHELIFGKQEKRKMEKEAMNVRIRLQGKPEKIAEIKQHLEKHFEIHWTGQYQDFTKRWSKDAGKNPSGKIRIYGYIKKVKE